MAVFVYYINISDDFNFFGVRLGFYGEKNC